MGPLEPVGEASQPESGGLRPESQENRSTVGDQQPRGYVVCTRVWEKGSLWGPGCLTCSLRSRVGFSLCLAPK